MVESHGVIQGRTSLPRDILAAIERGREDNAAEACEHEGFEAEKSDRRRCQVRSRELMHVVLIGIGLPGITLGEAGESVAGLVTQPPVIAVPEGDLAAGGSG